MNTKPIRGQDGRTAFERLYGKLARREAFGLGEDVLWRRPKRPGRNALLESRWEEGIWSGRMWGSVVRLIEVCREVIQTRVEQRRPKEDMWNKEFVQGLLATPRCVPVHF